MKSEEQKEQGGRKPKRPSTSPGEPKGASVVISFRLSKSEYEPFRLPVEKSGKSRSEFFRQLFQAEKNKVVISEKKAATQDYNQYLHLVNKISNNLNQLARLLNGAEKSGKATRQQYLNGLNNLNSIRLLLESKLGKKD